MGQATTLAETAKQMRYAWCLPESSQSNLHHLPTAFRGCEIEQTAKNIKLKLKGLTMIENILTIIVVLILGAFIGLGVIFAILYFGLEDK